VHAAEIPAANAITNAGRLPGGRGNARPVDGVQLVETGTPTARTQIHAAFADPGREPSVAYVMNTTGDQPAGDLPAQRLIEAAVAVADGA